MLFVDALLGRALIFVLVHGTDLMVGVDVCRLAFGKFFLQSGYSGILFSKAAVLLRNFRSHFLPEIRDFKDMRLSFLSKDFLVAGPVAVQLVKLVESAEQRLSDFLWRHIRNRVAECVGERAFALSRLIHGRFNIMDLPDSSCDLVCFHKVLLTSTKLMKNTDISK